MNRSRLIVLILGALGVLGAVVVLVWAVAMPGSHDGSPVVAAAPAPASRPTDPTWPPGVPSPPPAASPPAPSSQPSVAPAARAGAVAEPFVQGFAQQPGVRPLRRLPSPTAKLTQPANIDGCDHGYGERTQCVPAAFPPGVTDKCGWLTAHGFDAIPVLGKDSQHLDPDGDRIACD